MALSPLRAITDVSFATRLRSRPTRAPPPPPPPGRHLLRAGILGVCTTVLKKICREHGLKRWPQRKLQSINKMMASVECAMRNSTGADRERLEAELEVLRQRRREIAPMCPEYVPQEARRAQPAAGMPHLHSAAVAACPGAEYYVQLNQAAFAMPTQPHHPHHPALGGERQAGAAAVDANTYAQMMAQHGAAAGFPQVISAFSHGGVPQHHLAIPGGQVGIFAAPAAAQPQLFAPGAQPPPPRAAASHSFRRHPARRPASTPSAAAPRRGHQL